MSGDGGKKKSVVCISLRDTGDYSLALRLDSQLTCGLFSYSVYMLWILY